jgi:4-amino-4-deoxy-L-arabinose transferase-like glycosyltransferase
MNDESLAAAPEDVDSHPAIAQALNAQPLLQGADDEHCKTPGPAEDGFALLHNLRAALATAQTELHQLETRLRLGMWPPAAPAPAQPATPWQLPTAQAWFFVSALLTSALLLFVRLFELDSLQSEVYGDIQTVHQYVKGVLGGDWPIRFTLSVGPLYHYVIAPVVALAGLDYFGLKLAAVIVSVGVLLATYALSRNLIDDYFALLAVAIAGVSSWLLIFSRLGDVEILVPLLITSALWLVVRIAKQPRPADLIACAVVSALGLYTYPQSFVLPGVTFITLLCLRWAGHPIAWADLRRFVLVTIVCAVPFAWVVYLDSANFTVGYIGGKIVAEGSWIEALLSNSVNALLAFHVRGDVGFRGNPNQLPHLDRMSGLLFLAGLGFWLAPARRRWSPVLLAPFLLLQLPSVLVLGRPSEVPSASRTLGVAPIAYILVASGLWWFVQFTTRLGRRRAGLALAAVLLGAIVLLNAQRYFGAYINGLPYHNTPLGHRIALFADALPRDTQVYIVGCCWESEMPELPYVRLMAARPQNLRSLEPSQLSCDQLQFLKQPAVLIWSFQAALPGPGVAACSKWLPAQLYTSAAGLPVFNAAPLRLDLAAPPAGTLPIAQSAADEPLEYESAELDRQMIGVRYSTQDMGRAADLFDGDKQTLIRGESANPMVIELRFARPRAVESISLDLGAMERYAVKVQTRSVEHTVTTFTKDFEDPSAEPHVDLPLGDGQQNVAVLRIEIKDLRPQPAEGYHVHVREVEIR